MNLNYNLQFDKLCETFYLGEIISEPKQISGGHLHKMFAVETVSGKYAVKALNPQVMLRSAAMPDIINGEQTAQIAAKTIPAAYAKKFSGDYIIEIDGQFYLVFDWIDGSPIYSERINVYHCKTMGKILAELHQIDFSSLDLKDDYSSEEKIVDWDYYLEQGKKISAVWLGVFNDNIENLYKWNKLLFDSTKRLAGSKTVISHGDLEPKNVIWQNDNPIIIELGIFRFY